MPSWNAILKQLHTAGSSHDVVRRKYLKRLHKKTGRNIILYYSGWLQKTNMPGPSLSLNDSDKNGFMAVIHEMDRTLGLDLLLHTPGGSVASTESLVNYLRQMFDTDIRVFVPQLAMSAGTMIACSGKSIHMGKQSSLGPIDPQIGPGIPAHGIVEEFYRAHAEVKADPSKIAIWQPIIAKYGPTLIGECEKAIQWANDLVKDWLVTGMLAQEKDKDALADKIIQELGDHALMKSHGRQLSAARCKSMGLKIEMLEDDNDLQDAVLSVHHACIHTLTSTGAGKIIENHRGVAFIQAIQTVILAPGGAIATQSKADE